MPITTTSGVRTNNDQQPSADNKKPAQTDVSGERAMPAISHAFALLIIAIASIALAPAGARAENIDQDKDRSGPKLFAASCADCHRSARGLAKGRLSILLSYYLQQHYTTSSTTAQTLTAYLQSVDTPPRSKPPAGKAQPGKPQPPVTQSAATATTTGLSVPRPPAPVPGR